MASLAAEVAWNLSFRPKWPVVIYESIMQPGEFHSCALSFWYPTTLKPVALISNGSIIPLNLLEVAR